MCVVGLLDPRSEPTVVTSRILPVLDDVQEDVHESLLLPCMAVAGTDEEQAR